MFRLNKRVRRVVIDDLHILSVPLEFDLARAQRDGAKLHRFREPTGVLEVAQRRRLAAVHNGVDPFAMMTRRRRNRFRSLLLRSRFALCEKGELMGLSPRFSI